MRDIIALALVLGSVFLVPARTVAESTIDPNKLPGNFFLSGYWRATDHYVYLGNDYERTIYVVPANGKSRHVLVKNYSTVLHLAWHEKRKRLAFYLINRELTPNGMVEFDFSSWQGEELFPHSALNSLPDNLRTAKASKFEPRVTISPDGLKLAGLSKRSVCITKLDGNEPAKCIEEPRGCYSPPIWSPDGKQIVFVGQTVNDRGKCRLMELYIADADGQNVRQLTNIPGKRIVKEGVEVGYHQKTDTPAWSPDGEWIAFVSSQGLGKIRPDGTGLQIIAKNAVYPAWSPDSKMIAYVAARGDSPETFRYGIYVSWADGTGETWITKDLEMLRDNGRLQFMYEDLNWAE